MKFLIDECLSPELAKLAQERGYAAGHVVYLGHSGRKDWELKKIILDGDWTFVTQNSVDFRGPVDAPGTKGEYSKVALHAGLVCINGPKGMDLDLQMELFEEALAELESNADLVNPVLEINAEDEEIVVLRYALPPS